MIFKIPQGGHGVVAGVTAATLTLVGAAGLTVVLETPLTQALAAEPAVRSAPIVRRSHHAHPGAQEPVAGLARGACDRWMTNHASAIAPSGTPLVASPLLTSAALPGEPGASTIDPVFIFADQK